MSFVKKARSVLGPYRRAYQQQQLGVHGRRDALDMSHLWMLLAWTLRPTSNCVDVGSHRGHVLAQMIRLAPDGRHLAFEPVPEQATAISQRCPEAEVRQVAVDAVAGEVTFQQVGGAENAGGYSSLLERPLLPGHVATPITVSTVRLDDELQGRQVDFIKIDVESAELRVLQGAQETLRRCQPIVVVEAGVDHAELYRLMVGLGYRVFDIDGGGPYLDEAHFLDVAGRGALWNWVFVPAGQ